MSEAPRVLIIDDEDRYAELCHRLLPRYHYLTGCRQDGCPPCQRSDCTRRHAHDWYEARDILKREGKADVILLDLRFELGAERLLPEGLPEEGERLERARRLQGIEILRRIRRELGEVPVILMTRHDEIAFEDMADALSASDYTYLAADEGMNLRALEAQISSIVARRRQSAPKSDFFWGESPRMAQLRRSLGLLALGDRPVLILGETGTGKSYFVRQVLHAASGRKGPFTQVDLAALPDTLIPSELFGTSRGAFSGAIDRPGAFEHANGGTLFLDEIGNLPLEAQRRLLTVLQEKEVTRLGENRPRQVDVKVCAATNTDLEEEVRRGSFRNDLYMRLNPAARILLPPLRERREDIPALLDALLQKLFRQEVNARLLERYGQSARISIDSSLVTLGRKQKSAPSGEFLGLRFLLSEKSEAELLEYDWPGNVRQLEMVLGNAVLLSLLDSLAVSPRAALARRELPISPKALRDLLRQSDLGRQAKPGDGEGFWVQVQPSRTLRDAARGWEAEVYRRLFEETGGNFEEMGRRLLGDGSERGARRVRLRFNQLGLRARKPTG